MVIDLRSDTVTRPSPGMRKAIAEAVVDDDVLGDDPTAARLEARVAKMFGKEAAMFVPSGTMANQIAIRTLTEPGDEIIAHEHSHIYLYEGGAPCALSGCSVKLLPGERGVFDAAAVRGAMRAINNHFPRTKLVVIENTHNFGGGAVWPLESIAEVCGAARELGLRLHLDGARIMNACAASGASPADYGRHFDTISMCFSKGLGAPVGSILISSADRIERADRFRKMFGGAMRQVGILAAAAEYALDHNVERLAEDHANARRLAAALAARPWAVIDPAGVQTNIVYFDVTPEAGTAAQVCERLKARDVWMLPAAPQRVRAVTHLDVSAADVDAAIAAVREIG